jgi:hypothetical protein
MANEVRNLNAGKGQPQPAVTAAAPQQQRPAPPPEQRDPNTNQLVVPAEPHPHVPPQPGQTRVTWLDQAEAYLESKGWGRCGLNGRGQTLWDDPLGGKGKEKMGEERRLPMRTDRPDAQVTIVKQLEIPLRQWSYPTEEALGVQRNRDRAAAKVAG